MRRLAFLLIAAVCVTCKPAPKAPQTAAAQPTMRATVVTIRTTEDKTSHVHNLVIAGDKARFTGEQDTWRLFDTKARTVTFVDDVAKTVRTEALPQLVSRRKTANAAALPPHFPHARFSRTNERRNLHGATAQQSVIEAGAYRRELWLADHPSIPRGLFAMMHVSDAPSSPLAPMMREVDEALAGTTGFPLVDRTVVPLGKTDLVIERAVTGIGQRDVPQGVLAIPRGYRDLTPKPEAKRK